MADWHYVAHDTYVHATRPHSAALLIGYFERLAFPAHARVSSSCTRLVSSFLTHQTSSARGSWVPSYDSERVSSEDRVDASAHAITLRTGRSAKTDRIRVSAPFAAVTSGKNGRIGHVNVYTWMYSERDVQNCARFVRIDEIVHSQF